MYPCKTPACINPVSALNRTCRNCINEQGQQMRTLNQALPTNDAPSLSRQTSHRSSHSGYAAGSSSAGHSPPVPPPSSSGHRSSSRGRGTGGNPTQRPPPVPQMPPPQRSRASSSGSRPHHPSSHHQPDEITPAQPRDSSNQPKRFQCEQCDRSFAQKGGLDRHVSAVHNNERPFKCEECRHEFAQKGGLDRHVTAVHRKEKNYSCSCGAKFTDPSNLIAHKQQACPNLNVPQQNTAGAGPSAHPKPPPPPPPSQGQRRSH
jgi:C2H2-type zinc finger